MEHRSEHARRAHPLTVISAFGVWLAPTQAAPGTQMPDMLASVVPPGRSTTDVMFVRSTDTFASKNGSVQNVTAL